MKKLLAVVLSMLATAALIWLLFTSPRRPPRELPLAITHVTLIDGTGSPPQTDMTIVVAGRRIDAIGPAASVSIPFRAQVIDARGKFLIPGLADMHVHLTGAGEPQGSREFMLPLLLANGITTVRDMGGDLDSLGTLSLATEWGELSGPRIYWAGPYLDGDPPSFQPSIVVRNAAEARAAVLDLWRKGVSFFKVQSSLSRDAYFAIAAQAREMQYPFAGHVPDRVSAAEASDAGQASIEHLTGVLLGCSSKEELLWRKEFQKGPAHQSPKYAAARQRAWINELLESYSETKAAALFQRFVKNHTWQVPTLITLRNVAYVTPLADHSHDPEIAFVPRKLRDIWAQGLQERLHGKTQQDFALRASFLKRSQQIVHQMQAAGMGILAGTDTAAPYVFPGSSLHEELALLVESGLTPMQALQAATRNPAQFLKRAEFSGTVEPRKEADLLLLDANPLEDIHNTRKISAVVRRGRLYGRDRLDALIAQARKFAEEK